MLRCKRASTIKQNLDDKDKLGKSTPISHCKYLPKCTFSHNKQTCDLNHNHYIVSWQTTHSKPKQPSLPEMNPLNPFMQPRWELAHLVPTMALLQPSLYSSFLVHSTVLVNPPTSTFSGGVEPTCKHAETTFSAQYDITKVHYIGFG